MTRRLLVLASSIGKQHTLAAEALCRTAVQRFPELETRLFDVTAPGLRMRRRLLARVRRDRPQAVLMTHASGARLLGAGAQGLPPVEVVVTELDAQPHWTHPGVARYHVASTEVAAQLRAAGADPDRIGITGIPIRPSFARRPHRAALSELYGLDPDRPVVLIVCTGSGMASIEAVVRNLARLRRPLQLIAAVGRNHRLARRLSAVPTAPGVGLRVFGYVEAMHELMAMSDVLVGRCGSLTASEALAMGLPMVITHPVPGQRSAGAGQLIRVGAAVRANSPPALSFTVGCLLESPVRLAAMSQAARRAARPHAASAILERHVRNRGAITTRRLAALRRAKRRRGLSDRSG